MENFPTYVSYRFNDASSAKIYDNMRRVYLHLRVTNFISYYETSVFFLYFISTEHMLDFQKKYIRRTKFN